MFQPAHELDAVPFLGLLAQTSADRRLRISAATQTDWLLGNLRNLQEDFSSAAGRGSPWLTRLETGATWAIYALPPAPGVTLSALWRTLTAHERGWLTVGLLKVLLQAGTHSMLPRSGVLCDTQGQLWLVPPFRHLVEGASRTWDPWHFEEYALGGFSEVPTHGLAITLCRLLLEVPLTELYSLRTSPTPVPSARLPWLAPLDPLVAEAIDDLVSRRPPSPTASTRWEATLAVLEDQCQQAAPSGLGALVARAWPSTSQRHRWD